MLSEESMKISAPIVEMEDLVTNLVAPSIASDSASPSEPVPWFLV